MVIPMQVWQWINRNSGAVIAAFMVISAIIGAYTYMWTEINSVRTEVQVARTEINGVRETNQLILDNIRVLQEDNRLLLDDNRLLREEMRLLRLEMREEIDELETRLRADMERNHQQLTQALINHLHGDDGSAIFKAPLDSGQ